MARVWQWLRGPWPLLMAGSLGALLVLAAWTLPQLPGQLQDQPATAGRWLAATSTGYGVWASALVALGLFNVLHSPLLAAGLVAVALLASVHLARDLARLRRDIRLPTRLAEPGALGEPIDIGTVETVVRVRTALADPPAQALARAHAYLAARFPTVVSAEAGPTAPGEIDVPEDERLKAVEQRLLAYRNSRLGYLAPLLPLGLLLIVATIWFTIVFGWQVATPPLAPGDSFRAVNQGLVIQYYPASPDTGQAAAQITLDGVTRQVQPDAGRTQFAMGGAAVTLRHSTPALWVQSLDPATLLAQPHASAPVEAIGLVFPEPGGEESLLLPSESAGLRLVRRTDLDDTFVVELYRSTDVQPSLRAEVRMPDVLTVPLAEGRDVRVTPTRALQADVRYLPGLWLAWVGLACLLAGALGAWQRRGFVLVQLSPWPQDRTLLVAQTSRRADLDRLVEHLGPERPSAPAVSASPHAAR